MTPATSDCNVTPKGPTALLSKPSTLISATNPDTDDSAKGFSQESNASMSAGGGANSSCLSDELGHSADDSRDDTAAAATRRSLRQQSKEQAIEHVLQQGKILKVSRRLRTRLEYAILKIRRGWSKYTLQEVESLMQPGMSPRITSKRPLAIATSPRYSSRKRVRKVYPECEQPSDLSRHIQHHNSNNNQDNMEETLSSSDPRTSPTDPMAAAAGQGRRYRPRPSFSQFKDSELFLPAKSLMDIATSSPSQSPRLNSGSGFSTFPNQYGNQSPYGSPGSPLYRDSTPVSNWSSFSQPTSPVITSSATMMSAAAASLVQQYDDESKDDGSEAPSDTQAARTILLFASSPTRPPPRTLDQGYLNRTQAAETAAAAARSPTASPVLKHAELATSLTPLSGLTSGLTSYSPMTSSPLVQFQTTAASTPSPDRSPTLADNSPFLVKRAGGGGAKGGSNSSLASDSGKQGLSISLNASATKHEPTSPSPLSGSSLPILDSSPSLSLVSAVPQQTTVRAMTPPPAKDETSSCLSASPPPSTSSSRSAILPRTPSPRRRRSQADAALGVRSPPPSIGKEGMSLRHYNNIATSAGAGSGVVSGAAAGGGGSIAQSIAARRRNSGLAGGSGLDMVFPAHPSATAAGSEESSHK
ncbi:hypothetical protein BGW39_008152 [Mortierella sp. 14UC]|nr:hypothetical protein BGW39_008152 [Mortierella sp. 14UC]